MQPKPPLTPQTALVNARVVWFALIAGQLVFLFVVLVIGRQGAAANPKTGQLLFYISLAMLVTAAAVGPILRRSLYGPDEPVPPQRFLTGTVTHLALLEGPSFLGLVGVMLGGATWPTLIVPIIAMALQAISFPSGTVMGE
jgi:hypothetical protein